MFDLRSKTLTLACATRGRAARPRRPARPRRRPARLRARPLAPRPRARPRARRPLRARAVRAWRGARRPPPPALRPHAARRGGRRVRVAVPYVRYGPRRASPTTTGRTRARGWAAASTTAGRPQAIARRHPGKARPLKRVAVDDRGMAGAGGAATRDAPRHRRHRHRLAAASHSRDRGPARRRRHSFSSGRVVADALTRPGGRSGRAAACIRGPPAARGRPRHQGAAPARRRPRVRLGLWQGCVEQRTIDPLLPARPVERSSRADTWRSHRTARGGSPRPNGS